MWDGFESFPRRHDLIVRIGFSDLPLGVDLVDGEIARAVEVEIGIEHLGIETIDGSSVFLRNVAVSHDLADDGTVLAFGERVIVRLARTRASKFDTQFFQKSGDFVVDEFGA